MRASFYDLPPGPSSSPELIKANWIADGFSIFALSLWGLFQIWTGQPGPCPQQALGFGFWFCSLNKGRCQMKWQLIKRIVWPFLKGLAFRSAAGHSSGMVQNRRCETAQMAIWAKKLLSTLAAAITKFCEFYECRGSSQGLWFMLCNETQFAKSN